MITRLRLENFKCFDKLDLELPRFGCFIGPNNSGKSSIFDGIKLIGRISSGSIEEIFKGSCSLPSLLWAGARGPVIYLEIDGCLDRELVYGYDVALSDAMSPSRTPKIAAEKLRLPAYTVGGGVLFDRSIGGDLVDVEGRKYAIQQDRTVLSVVNAEQILTASFRRIANGASFHSFNPRSIAMPVPIGWAQRRNLGSDGYGLAALLDRMKVEDLNRFIKIQGNLIKSFPDVREIVLARSDHEERSFIDDDVDLNNRSAQGLWTQIGFRLASGWKISAPLASAGMLIYLAFLYVAEAENPPTTLLIEEPENGNHPRRLGEIIGILRKLTTPEENRPAVQVLMTTHSPFVLDHLTEDEVFVVRRDESTGASTVRPMTEVAHLKERRADFSLGEIWYNVGEDDMFAQPKPKRAKKKA